MAKVKNKKTSKREDEKSAIIELAQMLSGEKALQKREQKIKEAKEKAIRAQKEKLRAGITKGEVQLEDQYDEEFVDGKPKKVVQKIALYKWNAPVRLRYPFDSKAFMTITALALLFVLYLALLGNYGLMFSILALLFFLYVLMTTEPTTTEHQITTRGIDSMDKLYEWYMMDNFRFTRKNGQLMLIVETKLRLPAHLIMLLEKEEMTPIFLLLQDKLLYKDIRKQDRLDRMTFGEYIPLEDI